ncbi:MAG: radical SAM protein [Deltaproteobacteria bacterium]|nr:radical SAM protein [Deltaproteobacteria bacterium]
MPASPVTAAPEAGAALRGPTVWALPEPRRDLDPEQIFAAGLRHHAVANTAYPIAHRKTIWHLRRDRPEHAALIKQSFEEAGRICLYLHVPFCERRCAFCEYTVVERHDPDAEALYFDALEAELASYLALLDATKLELAGLDIGGGTPALVDPKRLGRLLDRVRGAFRLAPGFGISVETTPKVAAERPEHIAALRSLGIERISMGLQMANPRLLRLYGRDLNDVTFNGRAVAAIRRAGFARFNIDVMYGFARQGLDELSATLEHTVALDPEVITLYRMRYKGTRLQRERHDISLERVVEMLESAHGYLNAHGYLAPPGKNGYSRVAGDPGTSVYLTERVVRSTPYLGLGLGAQTFGNNLLGYNLGAASKRLDEYVAAARDGELPLQDLYLLTRDEGMAKMAAVSFYFGAIEGRTFEQRFGVPLAARYPREVAFAIERGLMAWRGDALALTEAGARCFNGVVALFYSDRVKQHLLERKP